MKLLKFNHSTELLALQLVDIQAIFDSSSMLEASHTLGNETPQV